MHIFQISRGFLINIDQITHLRVVSGESIHDGVLEVYLTGKLEPIRIEDSKEADKLISRCETLSIR